MPTAEIDVDEALVRALLEQQHPDLAPLRLTPLANGWDNALFRLGEDLVVRLPRRKLAVPLLYNEQQWLPTLAPHLPLPVPAPVRIGEPGPIYPWPWSICWWLDGEPALTAPLAAPLVAATELGHFLAALHQPAPVDAPVNLYRGVHLAEREAIVLGAVERLGDAIDGARVRELWAELSAAPIWSGPPLWLHGDVHPGNLLVKDGKLSAVIDFGDLTSGDPATDLAVAWMLFLPEVRPVLRDAVGDVDDATWTRARAWALAFGTVLSASSADNPPYAALGARTLAAALEG
jgi:aminoglycoside phosphotransferase (APT) family kinase protein